MSGISFVVPVFNGEAWLGKVLEAILAEARSVDLPSEVLVVDDGSRDRSREIAADFVARGELQLLQGEGRGAAAALNLGIGRASFGLIAQVDQDVVLLPGWLRALLCAMDDPAVAAAQGVYRAQRTDPIWARISGYDLELRYARLNHRAVDHVCSGNTLYRATALDAVGRFDESLGYGYDNDLSYRLVATGHRLVMVPEAGSLHHWPDRGATYVRQQYGLGYGRLDLVAKHPNRVAGDAVSGLGMIAEVPLTLAMLIAWTGALLLLCTGGDWLYLAVLGAAGAGPIVAGFLFTALRAAFRFRDPAALAMVGAHLLRNLVWVGALAAWTWRYLVGSGSKPGHSMRR